MSAKPCALRRAYRAKNLLKSLIFLVRMPLIY